MRESTEDAALNIGNLLVEIVNIATNGNKKIKQSLSGFVRSEDTAHQSETIDRQAEMFRAMIDEIRGFFDRQLELSQAASSATRKIFNTANKISQLMRSRKMLAIK